MLRVQCFVRGDWSATRGFYADSGRAVRVGSEPGRESEMIELTISETFQTGFAIFFCVCYLSDLQLLLELGQSLPLNVYTDNSC